MESIFKYFTPTLYSPGHLDEGIITTVKINIHKTKNNQNATIYFRSKKVPVGRRSYSNIGTLNIVKNIIITYLYIFSLEISRQGKIKQTNNKIRDHIEQSNNQNKNQFKSYKSRQIMRKNEFY